MTITSTVGSSWIHDVCQKTSSAIGWNLAYHPAEDADGEPWGAGTDVTWQTDVNDGVDVIGRLRLSSDVNELDETDLRTAVATTNVVAELVGHLAAAHRKLDVRSSEVQTLMELGRALPQDGSLSGSLQRLLKAAVQLSGYWAAAFFLVDSQGARMRLRAMHGIERRTIPWPDRPLDMSCPDRTALLHGVGAVDGADPQFASWLPASCTVGFCVPVNSAEGPLGCLWCYDRRRRPVTDRDVHVLQSVAAQIAAALERTVLLRESAARKRMREELQAASLRHPGGAVCNSPVDSGLDVAFRSASAAELGGDLCEVWPAGPQRTLIAVGDAVGHSVPAALIMAIARGSLRTLLHGGQENLVRTDALMRRINQALCTVTLAEQFMTMVYAVIDQKKMTMTYTNAGHPPPWLSRNGRRTPLQSHGLLLGVMPEAGYQHSVVPLQPGDLLVFFTDGVSEAMSRDRSIFRTEGVLNALGDDPHQSAAEAADAVWSRLRGHIGESEPADDQTLLVVKIQPQ
jgi:sigma-B regulation protein RsbU (phosphoserine phosphatase)